MSEIYLLAADMSDAVYRNLFVPGTLIVDILMFLASIAVIILILMQPSNSDGIQGITASSETFFGKNKGNSLESKLKKWSWICLIVLAVLSIFVYILQLCIN